MGHNSDHIPAIAAAIWEAAPEQVYYDMWYDDLDFSNASENFADIQQEEFYGEHFEMDVGATESALFIEDTYEDALEKAAYQTTINNQQKMGLMQQGFTADEAEMRNPGTSGIMTPWGYGMEDGDVDTLMYEYPGLGAYVGTDINKWDDLDSLADTMVRQGSADLDKVVDNVEEIATNQGALDNVMDFFGSVGSSLGDAISQTPDFVDKWSMALVGEEYLGPAVETVVGVGQAAFKDFEKVGAGQLQEAESQIDLGKSVRDNISEGLSDIVDASEQAMAMQAQSMRDQAAIADIAGTAGMEAAQNLVSAAAQMLPEMKAGQPGGFFGQVSRTGPFGAIPGASQPPEIIWGGTPQTTKKLEQFELRAKHQVFMDGLNELGVAGMAEQIGDPANYTSGEYIAEDVEEWLNSLATLGEDDDAIADLRLAFNDRDRIDEQVAADPALDINIANIAGKVVEEQKADITYGRIDPPYRAAVEPTFETPLETTVADEPLLTDEPDDVGVTDDVEEPGQTKKRYSDPLSGIEVVMSEWDYVKWYKDEGWVESLDQTGVADLQMATAQPPRESPLGGPQANLYWEDFEDWKYITGEEGTEPELRAEFQASEFFDPARYGLDVTEAAEAARIPSDALVGELEGVDFYTEFWGQFNQLRGSGSPEAQRTIGPQLQSEVETLFYLLEGYPDDGRTDIPFSVSTVLLNLEDPTATTALGTDNFGLDPLNWEGPRARRVEKIYGDYVNDFFSDPSELRYGDAFYEGVENLRNDMAFYEDKPLMDKISYWDNWNEDGENEGRSQSRTPVDDVYAYHQFMNPNDDRATDRLSRLVAMYNTPEGSDAWFRKQQRGIYANLYRDWLRADYSPESFLKTFVRGGTPSGEQELTEITGG